MIHKNKEPIVITGCGVLSPWGVGHDPFWSAIVEGKCGINKIKSFPVDDDFYLCKIAAEVPEFDPSPWIFIEDPSFKLRYTQLAITALGMALEDSNLVKEKELLNESALFTGSAAQSADTMEMLIDQWVKGSLVKLAPDTFSQVDPYFVVSALVNNFGLEAGAINATASCASGAVALMLCVEEIRRGRLKTGIVLGADPITPITFMLEGLTGELSRRNDDPTSASRPFDQGQDGYVFGEGAVALVIETASRAQERGAKIYGELGPFSSTTDATSFSYIDIEGKEIARGMEMVLSRVPSRDIGYVNAHAPGIAALDRAESNAIKRAFVDMEKTIPVTSIKGAIGNPSAAGGLLQLVSALLSISEGVIPPTINLYEPLPDCDLDYVTGSSRKKMIDTVLVSTHGGGGVNVAFTMHNYKRR